MSEAIGLGISASFFDADVFRDAGANQTLRRTTLLMLFFAGVSRALGMSAILALNQVPGRRYPPVLAVEGLVFVGAAIVYSACAMVAAAFFLGREAIAVELFWIVALAHAPNLLGVLILMPYLGEAIDRAIRLWATVLVFFGLHRGLGLPMHAAIGVALLGWLTYEVAFVVLGRKIQTLVAGAKSLAAGRPMGPNEKSRRFGSRRRK